MPAPMRATPATSDAPISSPSANAEITMPRPGVAMSAMDIVLAGTWRPASTTAQYAKAVATGPT
jgi:hypothetical protein